MNDRSTGTVVYILWKENLICNPNTVLKTQTKKGE
jgi:hypothetical protein